MTQAAKKELWHLKLDAVLATLEQMRDDFRRDYENPGVGTTAEQRYAMATNVLEVAAAIHAHTKQEITQAFSKRILQRVQAAEKPAEVEQPVLVNELVEDGQNPTAS